MPITPDYTVRADDFINESEKDATPANDEGRVPKLESDAKISKEFIRFDVPIIRKYVDTSVSKGSGTTRFDITNTSGNTFRYTYDGTGTDPVINSSTFPVGYGVQVFSSNFGDYSGESKYNNGYFAITGSGDNYFEVTNVKGVAQNNVTLSDGVLKVDTVQVWTKPAGLKYVIVELVGGGAGSDGIQNSQYEVATSGGGAGGYSKKIILAGSLGATENIFVGFGGYRGDGSSTYTTKATDGATSKFGSHLYATGGTSDGSRFPSGGLGYNGDINLYGGDGFERDPDASSTGHATNRPGAGGVSFFGGQIAYGSGAEGGYKDSSSSYATGVGNNGNAGIVIVTEFYN